MLKVPLPISIQKTISVHIFFRKGKSLFIYLFFFLCLWLKDFSSKNIVVLYEPLRKHHKTWLVSALQNKKKQFDKRNTCA